MKEYEEGINTLDGNLSKEKPAMPMTTCTGAL